MTQPILIHHLGLTKLYLWPEAGRFQTYPQALARLSTNPELLHGATRRQIGELLFRLAYVKGRKPLRENVLTNIFGAVQINADKLVLRGVNLFRRSEPNHLRPISGGWLMQWETQDDLWLPTLEAVALGTAYRDDPIGSTWVLLLAEQLARYDVRIRLVLGLLAEGWRLVFAGGGFFLGVHRLARLVGKGQSLALFEKDAALFNLLLEQRRWQAIGPWWQADLAGQGYTLAEDFHLEGVQNTPPSTNKLNYNLRNGLTVFKHLDLLVNLGDGWGWNEALAERLLSAQLVSDLGVKVPAQEALSLLQALQQAASELADSAGFVIADQLAARWLELCGLTSAEQTPFDDFIRRSLYADQVRILETHPGQPRMGRGLLGNSDQRRVRLAFDQWNEMGKV
ncbi:MAG: hypothetical protein PHQ40_00810 [Anaerolineaceae bacterium]|nr:hypothetical protein [Anaerolineaceae bacterium]